MTTLSKEVQAIIEELRFRIGGACLGIILFGSRARGDSSPSSDTDLLLVLADVGFSEAERTARDVESRLAYASKVTLNIDSWSQLRHFTATGDPFVLAIIKEGRLLVGDPRWLEILREECSGREWKTEDAVKYLRSKADYHKQGLLRKLHEVASEMQLWLMAEAGTAACRSKPAVLLESDLHKLSTWQGIQESLTDWLDEPATDLVRSLTLLHKGLSGTVYSDSARIESGLRNLNTLLEQGAFGTERSPNTGPQADV